MTNYRDEPASVGVGYVEQRRGRQEGLDNGRDVVESLLSKPVGHREILVPLNYVVGNDTAQKRVLQQASVKLGQVRNYSKSTPVAFREITAAGLVRADRIVDEENGLVLVRVWLTGKPKPPRSARAVTPRTPKSPPNITVNVYADGSSRSA